MIDSRMIRGNFTKEKTLSSQVIGAERFGARWLDTAFRFPHRGTGSTEEERRGFGRMIDISRKELKN